MTKLKEQRDLVLSIKANDESVLKRLYQNNFRKVEHYILKNSGTMPQAKDIYQEAFIAVWQNIRDGKFNPHSESSLQGYLFQIAKNKWTDVLRSNRFKKTNPLDNVKELSHEEYNIESDDWDKEQKISLTEKAFKMMGNECRELLAQFYYQKRSMREIALFLNIEEASARNKKYRCIQQLKNLVVSQR